MGLTKLIVLAEAARKLINALGIHVKFEIGRRKNRRS